MVTRVARVLSVLIAASGAQSVHAGGTERIPPVVIVEAAGLKGQDPASLWLGRCAASGLGRAIESALSPADTQVLEELLASLFRPIGNTTLRIGSFGGGVAAGQHADEDSRASFQFTAEAIGSKDLAELAARTGGESVAGDGAAVLSIAPSAAPLDGWAVVSGASVAEWAAHNTAIGKTRAVPSSNAAPSGTFRFWLDVNRLRHELGSTFEGGRADRLLRAFRLTNARAAGVHARLVPTAQVPTRDPSLPSISGDAAKYAGPPLLAIDLTWSARGEPRGSARTTPLTTLHWPASQVKFAPPQGVPFVSVVRLPWNMWLGSGVSFYGAWCEPAERDAFASQLNAFRRDHGTKLDQFFAGVDQSLVVHPLADPQSGGISLRGIVTLRASQSTPDAMARLGEIARALAGAAMVDCTGDRVEIQLSAGWWVRSVTITPSSAAPANGSGEPVHTLHLDVVLGEDKSK